MNTNKDYDWAPLLLRLGVGLIFIFSGWGKVNGLTGHLFQGEEWGFINTVADIGFPFPLIFASVVALTEFFGGIMVLIGFRIKIPSLLLAVVMVVALFGTKLGGGFRAARLDLLLLFVTLALAIIGSGKYSLDALLGKGDGDDATP